MKKILGLMFGALLISGVAVAQQAFEELDSDADGVLSKAEAEMVETLDFDAADTDQDGNLSQEEYEAAASDE